jgi:hypothetical protein
VSRVDDVVVFPASILSDEDDAEETVREWATRAGNIADARKMRPPISVRFIDSNGQCFCHWSLTQTVGKIESHAAASKQDRNPAPWFIVLEDAQEQTVKVRLEIDPQPTQ